MSHLPLDIHRGGSGEPLVLIHGIGSTWRMWRPVLPLLEPHHDVLAVDLPGFGKSPPLPEGTPPTPEALTDAVEREMDAAGFDTAHLVGNSLGGRISAELARRGRARTVVLSSPAGLATEREKRYAEMQLALTIGAARRLPSAVFRLPGAAFLSVMYGRPWRMKPDFLVEQIECLAGSADFEETLRLVHAGQPPGLDQIRAPVLIAWGKRDRLLPPRQGKRWERVLPNAELRYLEGLGHVPPTDGPDLLAATIRSWTSRRAAAPA